MSRVGFLLLTTVLLSLLVASAPMLIAAEAEPTANNYVFRRSWGAEGDQLRQPSGVAIGPDGAIFVANYGLHRITRISPAERTFFVWGGFGLGNGQFRSPFGIAIDGSGNVYVADTFNARIQKFSSSGEYLTQWGSGGSGDGQFNQPYGVAVDSSGNVYVADTFNYRIQKFTLATPCPGGTTQVVPGVCFVTKWGIEGSGNRQFNWPYGVAVDSSGNVYVADTYNYRIQKFTSSGVYQTQWGTPGGGDGQFNRPYGVAVDSSGNVYVADTFNYRIQKFTLATPCPGGTTQVVLGVCFVTKWGEFGGGDGQFNYPVDIATDGSGNVYVAEESNHRIQKFTFATPCPGGTTQVVPGVCFVAKWGSPGVGDGQFDRPWGIAVDGGGNEYVVDWNSHRIQKFSSSGTYLTQWGSQGSDDGQFSFPSVIAVDGSGNVYVVDRGNNRLQTFTFATPCPGGTTQVVPGVCFITKWGSLGSGDGQFNQPGGIAIDGSGNVYVADTFNYRIQKFTLATPCPGGTTQVVLGVCFVTKWGSQGSGDGQFNQPEGIATDGSDNVLVADWGNSRIQKFSSGGTYLTQWGSLGIYDGQFAYPEGIAVDGSGNVYVADTYNGRVQKFTLATPCPGGTIQVVPGVCFVTKWGTLGGGHGQFLSPRGIAVDGSGNVYVADWDNHRIQMFRDGYPPPHPVSGLALNGSFEATPALIEWTYGTTTDTLPVTLSTTNTVTGTYALQLGAPVSNTAQGQGQAWAHQTFYVDPGWSRPVLSFVYNMWVNDIVDWSDFFVEIQDGAGLNHLATVLRDGFPCNYAPPAATNLGWHTRSYDLSAYKGQSIRLVFANRNLFPGSLGIWTYVDDVRVVDAGPLPPYAVFLPSVLKNVPPTSCP